MTDCTTCKVPCASEQPRNDAAEALRHIANDVRNAGDVPLVALSHEGVSPSATTLADELWLIALSLDSHMSTADPGWSDETRRQPQDDTP